MSMPAMSSSRARPPDRLSLMLLTVLIAALLACGKIKETITEKAAEKAVEEATGQKVDFEDNRVKLKDEHGNTAEWGANAKLPDGWPKELSPYPGAKLVASYGARKNDKLSGTISMQTSDSADQVLAHYAKVLSDFKLKQEMNIGGMQTKSYEKDGRNVAVNAVTKDNQTHATLIVSNF